MTRGPSSLVTFVGSNSPPAKPRNAGSVRTNADACLSGLVDARSDTTETGVHETTDRKSTRLNSSPTQISPLPLHDALPICKAEKRRFGKDHRRRLSQWSRGRQERYH